MGRRTVTQYANQIKRVLSPGVVNDIGREVGFCFRERVITPYRLVLSLLAGHAMGKVETLADIQRAGWPRVVAHPRLPQIRTCPIKASYVVDNIVNRLLSVVRSRTDKSIELSRGVVTAPSYGKSKRSAGVDQAKTVIVTIAIEAAPV